MRNNRKGKVTKFYVFDYQLQYEKSWLIVNVTVRVANGKEQIYGFHVQDIPKPIQELNGLTFDETKPFWNAFLLVIAISIPLFNIFCIYRVIRSNAKFKWLWILFIVFSLVRIIFNWTTGQVFFNILSFQILGAGICRSGLYGPWMIQISLPIAGIVFLIIENIKKHKADVAEYDKRVAEMAAKYAVNPPAAEINSSEPEKDPTD